MNDDFPPPEQNSFFETLFQFVLIFLVSCCFASCIIGLGNMVLAAKLSLPQITGFHLAERSHYDVDYQTRIVNAFYLALFYVALLLFDQYKALFAGHIKLTKTNWRHDALVFSQNLIVIFTQISLVVNFSMVLVKASNSGLDPFNALDCPGFMLAVLGYLLIHLNYAIKMKWFG